MGARIDKSFSAGNPRRADLRVVPDTGAEERRRAERRPYSGRVEFVGMPKVELAALDFSAHGVGMLSSRMLSLGQTVDLAFLDGSIIVSGVVCRIRPVFTCDWQVGIDFLAIQPELAEVVQALA